jgi:hypothetical protein
MLRINGCCIGNPPINCCDTAFNYCFLSSFRGPLMALSATPRYDHNRWIHYKFQYG